MNVSDRSINTQRSATCRSQIKLENSPDTPLALTCSARGLASRGKVMCETADEVGTAQERSSCAGRTLNSKSN